MYSNSAWQRAGLRRMRALFRSGTSASLSILGLCVQSPLAAALLTVSASTCQYEQPCSFAPSQQANGAGVPISSSISRGFTFPTSPGYNYGYNIGASARAESSGPAILRAYASVGGFALIPAPSSTFALNFSAASVVAVSDELDLPFNGTFRFGWEVEGIGNVSYSAPGTAEQASAQAIMGFQCSTSYSFSGPRPCVTPNAPAPPPGSNQVIVRRTLDNGTFSEAITFDVPFFANVKTQVNLMFSAGAGLGFVYGTPTGTLNGLATADFLNTARLVSFTVLDANGNAVPNPLVNSASGFNYLSVNDPPETEVPEPSFSWLVGLGLIGVVAGRRRSKSRA